MTLEHCPMVVSYCKLVGGHIIFAFYKTIKYSEALV